MIKIEITPQNHDRHYLTATVLTQSCLTLCDPRDCSPEGSSVLEIFQATILEWVAISSSSGSSQPRVEPTSPESPALQEDSLPLESLGDI